MPEKIYSAQFGIWRTLGGDSSLIKKISAPQFVLISLFCFFVSQVKAADFEFQGQAPRLPDRWLTLGWLSLHANKRAERNGLNYGIGAELGLNPSWSLAAGVYQNSFDATSYYAGGIWRLWSIDRWHLGMMLGAANGYEKVNHSGAFPYVFPMLQFEGGWLGANLAIIPPVGNATHGLLALQFKFRL
jgi:hypothetical protein